ncbi:MAG: hypothetical protein CMD63_03030 [Gammaproteobacteria bacterium]|nr:hypothetical protein [Gammaproteobacteria bacterium]|tara:strand:- start:1767 stop:2258 length:492 start_codon:yes stop_codon:yes gene_type:complete
MSYLVNTADISDKFPETPFLLDFRSFGAKNYFCGEIITVECPDDNSLAKSILQKDGLGRVLFIEGNASDNVGLIGDNLVSIAKTNSWGAIIVNGRVRDVEELSSIEFPVFALGSCPKKSGKNNQGSYNVCFRIGEVQIKSGFWAYGDLTGILISEKRLDLEGS